MTDSLNSRYAAVKCPCCGFSGALRQYQERYDINGRKVDIATCLGCTALVNASDLKESRDSGKSEDIQRQASESYYKVDENTLASARDRANQMLELVDFALTHLGNDFPRRRFADFGAGMGFLSAAAALRFEKSYAIEYNTTALEQLHSLFENSERIQICTGIDALPTDVDLVASWHTIEHLPDAQAVLRNVHDHLSAGGGLFFQCPMFKPEYVVQTHYFFLNEFACHVMCELAGFEDIHVWFDMESEFITCLARKGRRSRRAVQKSTTRFSATRHHGLARTRGTSLLARARALLRRLAR